MTPPKNPIPTKEENPEGLHARYIVSKTDGSPVDEGAEYFVLRLDAGGKDPAHIRACRRAVLTYAMLISTHLPELAEDLIDRYHSMDDLPEIPDIEKGQCPECLTEVEQEELDMFGGYCEECGGFNGEHYV